METQSIARSNRHRMQLVLLSLSQRACPFIDAPITYQPLVLRQEHRHASINLADGKGDQHRGSRGILDPNPRKLTSTRRRT